MEEIDKGITNDIYAEISYYSTYSEDILPSVRNIIYQNISDEIDIGIEGEVLQELQKDMRY